jgi:hypothetical protein
MKILAPRVALRFFGALNRHYVAAKPNPTQELMKPFAILIATSLTLATSEAALTFNVNNIGPGGAGANASAGAIGAGDNGSVNVTYSPIPTNLNGVATGSFSITITDLTIDDVGFDDDSAVFTFLISATGGSGTINDNDLDWGVDGNGAGRLNATDEFLTFSFQSGSVALGSGTTNTGIYDFIGINALDLTQFTGDEVATLAFGAGSPSNLDLASNGGSSSFTFSADSSPMTVGFAGGDTTGGNVGFKVNDIQARFRVDYVPEPSAALLGSLGLLALLRRRR